MAVYHRAALSQPGETAFRVHVDDKYWGVFYATDAATAANIAYDRWVERKKTTPDRVIAYYANSASD